MVVPRVELLNPSRTRRREVIKSLAHYQNQLREKGPKRIIVDRWRWYKTSFQMDNWAIGRVIELTGNTVTLDGIKLRLDNPLVSTRHKSSIYFGMYEIEERDFSKRFIDRTLPTIEIGGSLGGVACITNKLLANPYRHVVVECNPIMLPTLTHNRNLNECTFFIEPCAIAYGTDSVSFSISDHFMLGGIHADGRKITVPATTLADLMRKHGFETINVITDCEGAEVEIVENELDLLRQRVAWIIMEAHEKERGTEAIAKMFSSLESAGFEIVARDPEKLVFALRNRALSNQ
jgi:FkbM family methyltransferase